MYRIHINALHAFEIEHKFDYDVGYGLPIVLLRIVFGTFITFRIIVTIVSKEYIISNLFFEIF